MHMLLFLADVLRTYRSRFSGRFSKTDQSLKFPYLRPDLVLNGNTYY